MVFIFVVINFFHIALVQVWHLQISQQQIHSIKILVFKTRVFRLKIEKMSLDFNFEKNRESLQEQRPFHMSKYPQPSGELSQNRSGLNQIRCSKRCTLCIEKAFWGFMVQVYTIHLFVWIVPFEFVYMFILWDIYHCLLCSCLR